MELWLPFGTFAALMAIGTPVAFCLGAASLATLVAMVLPPLIVFLRLNAGVAVFAPMVIPFFIGAGDLMMRGGIAARLVGLAEPLVGHLRGGLGQVNIAASTLLGDISGSAVADASAVGVQMSPHMRERGYDVDYAVNVTVTSSIIALRIPPSHNMIIYSISAGDRSRSPTSSPPGSCRASSSRSGSPPNGWRGAAATPSRPSRAGGCS